MKRWIVFCNILVRDMRAYCLKPPNIIWGLMFPLAWTGMFFGKSGSGLKSVRTEVIREIHDYRQRKLL